MSCLESVTSSLLHIKELVAAPFAAMVPDALRQRWFIIRRFIFVAFVFALDIRDLHYKLTALGPSDSFAFRTGPDNIYVPEALQSLVTDEMRDRGDVASGWSSMLSRCEELYPLGSFGTKFLIDVLATNCSVSVRFGGVSRRVPQLVVSSSFRVDALTWAACQLLQIGRRPRICALPMVRYFNQRYALDDRYVSPSIMAQVASAAEAELHQFLDLVSLSHPIEKVVCVGGFELRGREQGVYQATIFACASPNRYQAEFIGFEAKGVRRLLEGRGWLTSDMLSIARLQFGIRQNSETLFYVRNLKTGVLAVHTIADCNFSSHGQLYALMIILDVVLLGAHIRAVNKMYRWLTDPQLFSFQEWIRKFEKGESEIHPPAFLLQENHNVPPLGFRFHEETFYEFFSLSVYREPAYVFWVLVTRTLAWMIIIPNSVVWTWTDDSQQKWGAFLSSIKSWVIVASAFGLVWRVVVIVDEKRAYYFSRGTFIRNPEIVIISTLVALWNRQDIFSICELKWGFEKQRVNDVTSFANGYLLHGNTYSKANDYLHTTQLQALKIIFWPLITIISQSVVMIFAWLIGKFVLFRYLFKVHATIHRSTPYSRLPLEELLNLPIRSMSIVRNHFSMEMTREGKMYIRPSCYLDYGIMLKTRQLVNHVSYHTGQVVEKRN